jgi:hypothetical protein
MDGLGLPAAYAEEGDQAFTPIPLDYSIKPTGEETVYMPPTPIQAPAVKLGYRRIGHGIDPVTAYTDGHGAVGTKLTVEGPRLHQYSSQIGHERYIDAL